MSQQKAKGNRLEREVAAFLSEHHGASFQRTAHSGAFTGKSNAKRLTSMDKGLSKAFIGDIAQPEGITLVVECKNYADLKGGFHAIVGGYSNQLVEWIGEVEGDSNREVPYMLFFNITNKGMFIALPTKFFDIWNTLKEAVVPYTYFPIEQLDESITDYVVIASGYYEYIRDVVDEAIRKEYK